MVNGVLVSSQTIIRNVIRDSGLEEDIAWLDATEWIVEIMDLIDVPKSFVNDLEIIKVTDYKASLPCGYRQMIQASGSINGSGWFPMNYATNTFHPTTNYTKVNKQAGGTNISTFATWNGQQIDISNPIGYDINGNPLFPLNNFTDYSVSKFEYRHIPPENKNWATYTLGEGLIHTNFKEGYVYMAFNKYPVDCDGYPLIPDNQSFKEALKWGVQQKIDYKKWRMGEITDKVYQYTDQQRDWYVAQAKNSGLMPNMDEMESWKNMLRKFIINDNQHKSGFVNLQKR